MEKLNETKVKLQGATERLQATEEQYEITKREFQNIQEKYTEKVRERNKLQELYNNLKRKYDQTYRDNGRASSPIGESVVSPYNTKVCWFALFLT